MCHFGSHATHTMSRLQQYLIAAPFCPFCEGFARLTKIFLRNTAINLPT